VPQPSTRLWFSWLPPEKNALGISIF
jgi:hypothetical protein